MPGKEACAKKRGNNLIRTSRLVVIVLVLILAAVSVTYLILWPKEMPLHEENAITVTDALNRTVQIDLPINKVIITGKAAWPIVSLAYMFPSAKNRIYSLGQMIATTSLFRIIDPDIDSKVVAGLEMDIPNIEEIAAQNPDVVILKSYMKSNLGDPLESIGIKVVYVDLENLDTYLRDIKVLGKIFGDEAKAEEIANYYQEKHEFISSKTRSIENEDRPKVLLLYYDTKGGTISFNVPGARWLQTSMIEVAGGYPLSKELSGTGWNTVSFEQIARWNPDMIFVVTYSGDPSPSDIKHKLLDDPLWKSINALAEGKVYAFPHDCDNLLALGSWDSPCSRWILGIMWTAMKIHPSLFSDVNLAEEAKGFYMKMYCLNEDEAIAVINEITGDLK